MGERLASHGNGGVVLTDHRSVPFTICFRYKLFNNYTFKDMKPSHYKSWQNFLDHVSGMTLGDVDKTYRRDPDTQDTFHEQQIIHYKVDKKFRIHGVIENGQFMVLRIDPNHRVHKG